MQSGWQETIARHNSHQRAMEQALANVIISGNRMISRLICALGRAHQDWSAGYKIFSRSPWQENSLFEPVIHAFLERYLTGPVTLALDDTILEKNGLKIPSTTWLCDPNGLSTRLSALTVGDRGWKLLESDRVPRSFGPHRHPGPPPYGRRPVFP